MPKKSENLLHRHLLTTLIVMPIITGLLSGLLATYLYVHVIAPPSKPNLIITNSQMTFAKTPHSHYVTVGVFNNGSAPAQYLNLDISLTNATGYTITNVSQPYGAVSSVKGINIECCVSPVSIYLSTIEPGEWENIDVAVSNYSVEEGNSLILSPQVKTYLTIAYSSDSHVSILNYSIIGTTNNWTRTQIK